MGSVSIAIPKRSGHSILINEGKESKMSSRRKQGERVPKKPYTRPEVKQVQLKPEEAVLGGCKVSGQFGPAQPNCTVPPKCNALMS